VLRCAPHPVNQRSSIGGGPSLRPSHVSFRGTRAYGIQLRPAMRVRPTPHPVVPLCAAEPPLAGSSERRLHQNARIITQNNKTPGDLDGRPTRGVGRTRTAFLNSLVVGSSPTSSTTQSRNSGEFPPCAEMRLQGFPVVIGRLEVPRPTRRAKIPKQCSPLRSEPRITRSPCEYGAGRTDVLCFKGAHGVLIRS
jgi:hypothetical protein